MVRNSQDHWGSTLLPDEDSQALEATRVPNTESEEGWQERAPEPGADKLAHGRPDSGGDESSESTQEGHACAGEAAALVLQLSDSQTLLPSVRYQVQEARLFILEEQGRESGPHVDPVQLRARDGGPHAEGNL